MERSLLKHEYNKKNSSEFTLKIMCRDDIGNGIFDNLFSLLFRVYVAMLDIFDWKSIRLILLFEGVNGLNIDTKKEGNY